VFPTRVGMNRPNWLRFMGWCSVPHASGDEPDTYSLSQEDHACSPREWG